MDLEIGTPKYHNTKEYKIFSAKHSLTGLRFSPAMTPKRQFGLNSGMNSRKFVRSPFKLSEVKEKRKAKRSKKQSKRQSKPISKKMESDQSASSSESSDEDDNSENSSNSSSSGKKVISAISLKEVAPAKEIEIKPVQVTENKPHSFLSPEKNEK
jgi:hypothetical protein